MNFRASKPAMFLMSLILMLAAASCSDPLIPVLPDWDVPMNVPFSSQKITVREMLAQDTSITINIGLDGKITATLRSCVYEDTIAYKLTPEVIAKLRFADNGLLIFELENHLSAEAILEPAIMDEAYTTLFTPQTVSGELMRIAPATLSSDNETMLPVRSKIEIRLSNADFQHIIQGNNLYIRLRISTTGRMPITVTLDDFIKLQSYARVQVSSDIVI